MEKSVNSGSISACSWLLVCHVTNKGIMCLYPTYAISHKGTGGYAVANTYLGGKERQDRKSIYICCMTYFISLIYMYLQNM